jgi:hypothetical protein
MKRRRDLEVYELLRCKQLGLKVRETKRTCIIMMTPPTSTPHAKQNRNTTVVAAPFIYQPVLTNHIPELVHGLSSLCIQALQFPRLRFNNFPRTPEALTLAVQPTDQTTNPRDL